MKKEILYFERGYIDNTDKDDTYQCVGIHPLTLEILDKEELIFEEDLPDLSYLDNVNDLINRFLNKKWRLL